MNYIISLMLLNCFLTATSYGQDLSELRWKNRVLIVMTDGQTSKNWDNQLSELTNCTNDLEERKIVVYQVLHDRYRVVSENENAWTMSQQLYHKFKTNNSNFEVVLLGLDGGVKLRNSETVTCQQLNALIDQMPMRRAEMERHDKSQ